MQKDKIFITKVTKNFETTTFVGMKPIIRPLGITVEFIYETSEEYENQEGSIELTTTKIISEEEIKDKIIEVLQ